MLALGIVHDTVNSVKHIAWVDVVRCLHSLISYSLLENKLMLLSLQIFDTRCEKASFGTVFICFANIKLILAKGNEMIIFLCGLIILNFDYL